jgi:O-antigen ligase
MQPTPVTEEALGKGRDQASAVSEIPLAVRFCWGTLCLATLLNANGVAVLAGEPQGFLSLPLLGLVATVLYGMRHEARYMARPPASWVYLFFAGYLATGLLSACLSSYGDPWRAITAGLRNHCASLAVGTAGYFAATHASRAGRVDSLLRWLFWPCAAAALSGLVLPAHPVVGDQLELSETLGNRMEGVFTNTNELGLQSGYPIVLGLVLSLRTGKTFWLAVGMASGAVGVVASFSKAAMFALALLIPYVGWVGWKARAKLRGVGWAALLTGVGAAFAAGFLLSGAVQGTSSLDLDEDQQDRLEAIYRFATTGTVDDDLTTGRVDIWHECIGIWLTSPTLGTGLSTFDVVPGLELNSHNQFLTVLGESGLLGAAFLALALCGTIAALRRIEPGPTRALALGFLLVQFPLWMSSGQALCLRDHNLVAGCVLGLVAAAMPKSAPTRKTPHRRSTGSPSEAEPRSKEVRRQR